MLIGTKTRFCGRFEVWPKHSTLLAALIIAIGSFFPKSVAAQNADLTPFIRGPGAKQDQFMATAEALNQPTLADFLDENRPELAATEKLQRTFEVAQRNWLEGSIAKSRVHFKAITEMALADDWREPQRIVIQYSFLRLAQTASSEAEKSSWLKKSIDTFPDLMPEDSLFPPPLIEAFQDLRAKILGGAIEFDPHEHFSEFRYLLLNGRRIAIQPDLKIRLTNSRARVTLLSDAHSSITELLAREDLVNFRPTPIPLASGSCEKPSLAAAPTGVESLKVVYSDTCLRTRLSSGSWLSAEGGIKNEQQPPSQSTLPPLPSAPPSSWSKSKWALLGLSALAAGVWASQNYEFSAWNGQE